MQDFSSSSSSSSYSKGILREMRFRNLNDVDKSNLKLAAERESTAGSVDLSKKVGDEESKVSVRLFMKYSIMLLYAFLCIPY